MAVQRARSAEEYGEWVKQAKFETGDLRDCMMYDMEETGERLRFPMFLEPIEEGVERIFQSMVDGSYHFGREDLPFMEAAERFADDIPFILLLRQINETHRYGLDVPEE